MKKRLQQGFTLIELMIVIAITGILAAFSIPTYIDYTIRAKVTEGLILSSALKVSIAEAFQANGPSSMLCATDQATECDRIGAPLRNAAALALNKNIESITSAANGVITIS